MSHDRVAVTEELSNTVRTEYATATFTQSELAEKHGVSLPTINRMVKGIVLEKRKYTHKTSKFAERNAQILEKAKAGVSTRDIAKEFGVTHQNISLVLKKNGYIPIDAHKERLAVRSAARNERLEAVKTERNEARMNKVNALAALWKAGAPISEIREAAGLGSDNATQVKITLLRRKYGVEMFPRRPCFGRTDTVVAEAADERLRKVQILSQMWNEGKSAAECATAVGWLEKTFTRTLPNLRKQYGPEKFIYRRNRKVSGETVDSTVESPKD